METLHETNNSHLPQCFSQFPVLMALTYVSNHPPTGDLQRLRGLITISSVQHEVWSRVCTGTFGNRIVEALNPNLPTVMFYHQSSQGKPGVPPLVCS